MSFIKVDLLIWLQNAVMGQSSSGGKTQDSVKPVWNRPSQRLISLFGYKMVWWVEYDVMLWKITERWLSYKSYIMCGPIHPLYWQPSFGVSVTRRREKKQHDRRTRNDTTWKWSWWKRSTRGIMYLFETCICISFPFSYHKIKKKTKIGGQRWEVETDEKDQEGTWGRYEKLYLINGSFTLTIDHWVRRESSDQDHRTSTRHSLQYL